MNNKTCARNRQCLRPFMLLFFLFVKLLSFERSNSQSIALLSLPVPLSQDLILKVIVSFLVVTWIQASLAHVKHLYKLPPSLLPAGFDRYSRYRVFRKNCVFTQFTATLDSPTSLWESFKALNAIRRYSHSFFWTTNNNPVLARERWQTFENSWKK